MLYISAFFLAQLGGCEHPNTDDIKKIISASGADFDNKQAESLITSLSGKNIESLIAQGKSQLSTVLSGPLPASVALAAAAPSAAAAAPSKEVEKSKKKEESDEELNLSLFD
jgi:ribosomal protein L12E/L44/L45/RPP1/RPP2